MIRQYNPQRHRIATIGGRIRSVGTVPVGTIAIVRGRKLRVEAWIPRDYSAVERGRFVLRRLAGGHVALVRELATNRLAYLSDAFLVDAETVELERPQSVREVAEKERAGEAHDRMTRDRAYFAEGV